MVKLVYIVRRRQDVPSSEFYRYWRDNHGPLFQDRYAKTVRARKYVQSHTIEPDVNAQLAQSRGMGEAYDGVAELWWDSFEDLIAGFSTPEGQEASRALVEDETRFIDVARSFLFITEEHLIFDWSKST